MSQFHFMERDTSGRLGDVSSLATGESCQRRPMRASSVAIVVLVIFLFLAVPRQTRAEDRFDFKYMYYQEADDRIRVLTPTFFFEKDLSSTLTIKIEGVYNAISGASPTGAPPVGGPGTPSPAASQPYSVYVNQARENENTGSAHEQEDDEHEEEQEDHERSSLSKSGRSVIKGTGVTRTPSIPLAIHARTGATPQPPPKPPSQPAPPRSQSSAPSSSGGSAAPAPTSAPAAAPKLSGNVPTAEATDERTAFNVELAKRIEDHTVSALVAYSTESDYNSIGLALRDAIDFNKKNTTLQLGAAYTHDRVDAFSRGTTEDKNTIDVLLGVTQVLTPTTLFTVNLTLGQAHGYLDDQYKVVELNGVLIPEHRPDNKDKTIVYVSLNQFFKALNGAAEISYRYYDDTFGIVGNTYELAWYQHVGRHFVVRPMVRYYEQTAADFYAVRFTGSPQDYSADYRLSNLEATSYGLKVIWSPSSSLSFDVAVEKYDQKGKDGVTSQDAYPSANIVTVGARIWF